MTEQEAFEAAKQTILEQRPDADDFYLDEADFKDGNWIIMIGYLRYWDADDIGRKENEFLSLTEEDIGEPSGHWRSQVEILPNGDGILNGDDILDIHEHPECMAYTEGEWRRWAGGLRDDEDTEDEEEDQYKFSD